MELYNRPLNRVIFAHLYRQISIGILWSTLQLGVLIPHASTNGSTEGSFVSMLPALRVEEM
jgi:hypothetical protein